MRRRVVVTGLGAVTSISCQIEDLWKKILAGQSGVHELTVFDTREFKVHFGGDIADWSTEGYLPAKEAKRVDRFAQFALVAGTDAVNSSGLALNWLISWQYCSNKALSAPVITWYLSISFATSCQTDLAWPLMCRGQRGKLYSLSCLTLAVARSLLAVP